MTPEPAAANPYADPERDAGYHRASRLWEDRIGSSMAQARNWRLMAFACAALAAGAGAAYVAERRDHRIESYVVRIDSFGRPERIELASATANPTQAEMADFAADWIRLVRARSVDPIVVRDDWRRAFALSDPQAAAALGAFARAHDPFADIGRSAVTVEVSSVLQRSPNTFQVQWRETATDPVGRVEASRWTALVTLERRTPRTEADLRLSPLGLRVAAYQWSPET